MDASHMLNSIGHSRIIANQHNPARRTETTPTLDRVELAVTGRPRKSLGTRKDSDQFCHITQSQEDIFLNK
jgi:hypothetical protein